MARIFQFDKHRLLIELLSCLFQSIYMQPICFWKWSIKWEDSYNANTSASRVSTIRHVSLRHIPCSSCCSKQQFCWASQFHFHGLAESSISSESLPKVELQAFCAKFMAVFSQRSLDAFIAAFAQCNTSRQPFDSIVAQSDNTEGESI